ncbi:MAG: S9 family peptidase [Saprospiraceae bacterium]|nr:S9 family peptidase [Saprospiraceae bacterium]
MKQFVFLSTSLLILFTSCEMKEDTSFQPASYTIEQFYDNVRVTGGSFNSDASKLLVSSNESGIFNVYSLSADGKEKKALTDSNEESLFSIGYLPDSDDFLFSADKGGNEISHIYLQKADEEVVDLTPGENEKANFAGWHKDLEHFYYVSNERDANYFDMRKMNIKDMTSELVYENTDGLDIAQLSYNERYLVLTKPITTSTNEMILVDTETGERTNLNTVEGAYSPQFFTLDDKNLYFLTDGDGEFQSLKKYDLESQEVVDVYSTDWDIWYAYESWNGKYRVMGINEDGKTTVKLMDAKTGDEIAFPDVDGKSVSSVSISRDEKKMRLVAADSKSPSDLYVYDLASEELTRLTNTLNQQMKATDLVDGTVVRYKSFDGLEIPAIYYKPHQASVDNKVPALVWVHGGPGGQSRLSFFELVQYMVNQGYAVLAVNNRGSSGYGKTFFNMDNKKHGDVDLKDCVYGKKYLQTLDYIDSEKIGIIGGSYGGYMTMAALTFTPEEFDVGVNIFGVTNWLRTLKSIPPWWESFKDALYDEMGDPFSADSTRLYNISPLFHAQNVTKPLMVLQGANDPRVLQVESDEIVDAVKANGVPVDYVLFPDEGHGFRKKENQIKGYGDIVKFLDKYLKGEDLVAD